MSSGKVAFITAGGSGVGADEVSSLIAHLVSDDAASISGRNIRIDGALAHSV